VSRLRVFISGIAESDDQIHCQLPIADCQLPIEKPMTLRPIVTDSNWQSAIANRQ
jgi:hypothetical protein